MQEVKKEVRELESARKEKVWKTRELETEQAKLDRRIMKNFREKNEELNTLNGQVTDKRTQLQNDIMIGIELGYLKVEKQEADLLKMESDK